MKTYYVGSIPISDELYHYGIKGQKWGVRRYQNEDGSLTAAGRKKYGYTDSGKETGANSGYKSKRSANKNEEDNVAYKYNKAGESGWKGLGRAVKDKVSNINVDREKLKKGLIIGGSAVAAGLTAYGIYKLTSGNIPVPPNPISNWDPSPDDDPFHAMAKSGFRAIEEKYGSTIGSITMESIRTPKSSSEAFGNITKSALRDVEERSAKAMSSVDTWAKENHENIRRIHEEGTKKLNKAYEIAKEMRKQAKKVKNSA